jgi:hypothetical protein
LDIESSDESDSSSDSELETEPKRPKQMRSFDFKEGGDDDLPIAAALQGEGDEYVLVREKASPQKESNSQLAVPGPNKVVRSSAIEEKADETMHVLAPAFFTPYDIRIKRVGELDFVQVFLPSPPCGWKFSFVERSPLDIEINL